MGTSCLARSLHLRLQFSQIHSTRATSHEKRQLFDGAGPIRTFVYVTFPLMAPISIGAIIIRLIEASKIMDTVYVLTSGGPGTATETSSFYIFIKGLREFQFGYSAALSLTYLIIMIISFTIIAKILVKLMVRGN